VIATVIVPVIVMVFVIGHRRRVAVARPPVGVTDERGPGAVRHAGLDLGAARDPEV
jgi:hypothetical protein